MQTTIPYKPTTDCAYSKLINKIRGTYPQPQENPPAASSTSNSEQQQQISLYNQQYLQFYQQYGYYPQYYQGQGQSANFEQQYPLPANNAYSQIVSNVTQKGEKPIEGQGFNNGEISKAPILYKSTEGDEKIGEFYLILQFI